VGRQLPIPAISEYGIVLSGDRTILCICDGRWVWGILPSMPHILSTFIRRF